MSADVLALLREAEKAAQAYANAAHAAGYGYRNADDDARLLGWFEDQEADGGLLCSADEALVKALAAGESASPWDDRGYVHQGVADESADLAERIGVLKPWCWDCSEHAGENGCTHEGDA